MSQLNKTIMWIGPPNQKKIYNSVLENKIMRQIFLYMAYGVKKKCLPSKEMYYNPVVIHFWSGSAPTEGKILSCVSRLLSTTTTMSPKIGSPCGKVPSRENVREGFYLIIIQFC